MQYCKSQEQTLRELTAPRRNNYYYGKMLDVLHLKMEQDYGKQMRYLGNRLGLGSGVLCGLGVSVHDGQLYIDPGAAIDPLGREILVPNRMPLDPWTLVDPCGQVKGVLSKEEQHLVTLYLCYNECLTDHAPVLVSDCDQQEMSEAGTVVETFRFEVRKGLAQQQRLQLPAKCCDAMFTASESAQHPEFESKFEIVTTINVGGHPVAVSASADGKYVVVANEWEQYPRIQVIRVADNTFVEMGSDNIISPIGGTTLAPEGGPTFVSHAGGVAVIDHTKNPPRLVRELQKGTRYQACAAARGGDFLFATEGDLVHQIDTRDDKLLKKLAIGGIAIDLAVSADSNWLYVAREDGAIVRFEIADTKNRWVYEESATEPKTIAVRMHQGVAQPHVSAANNVMALREGGVESFTLQEVNVHDTAFTSTGELFYLTSAENIENPGQLVVYAAETMDEVARLPVEKAPSGVAIVPDTLLGYITNANSGTVTVIHGGWVDTPAEPIDPMKRLCECTSQACAEPTETCVPLAAIELRENGEIGRISECAVRPRIYSNQMLLEMIMCLAKRLDECCNEDNQATEAPPKVASVTVLDSNGDVIRAMTDPAKPLAFKDAQNVKSLRIVFTRPMDETSIVAGGVDADPRIQSFLVTRDPANLLPGRLTFEDEVTIRWDCLDGNVPLGQYTVRLFGDSDPSLGRPAITDREGLRLDGETGLPSGDNIEGGNFEFRFGVANVNPVDKSPKVTNVAILDANNDTLEVINNTNDVPSITHTKAVWSIRIGFSDRIDPDSIVATSPDQNLLNVRVMEEKRGLIAGKAKFTPPNQLVWTVSSASLAIGNYRLELIGDVNSNNTPQPIRGMNGLQLDGEAHGWLPSGDGTGGGNFTVNFKVIGIRKGGGT